MEIDSFLELIYNEENHINVMSMGECFCSNCKSDRNMRINMWEYIKPHGTSFNYTPLNTAFNIDKSSVTKERVIDSVFPSLWRATCLQCNADHYILLYKCNEEKKLILIGQSLSGVSTPNTPVAVQYYLDQAYKSKMIGANSACVAMYRGALEQIMYQQGYVDGMLNKKLIKLDQDILSGSAPDWTNSIDKDLLSYIKDLGNGSIHPNGGDITRQTQFDNNFVTTLNSLFGEFIDEIYEKPIKIANRKSLLKSAVNVINNRN